MRTLHIGEKSKANNGMEMTIIAYRSSADIDIQFDDGTVVRNKPYKDFLEGNIEKPLCKKIGEVSYSNSGEKMVIVCYTNNENIAVKFEDGTVVYGRTYNAFKKGEIKKPRIEKYSRNNKHNERIGIESINLNGLKIKIVEYRNSNDIDVKTEDGRVLKHQTFKKFKDGKIY